jgi:hypothetical protein
MVTDTLGDIPTASAEGSAEGNRFTLAPHRSWEWVRRNYPVRADAFDECEGYLRVGEAANLVPGEHPIDLPEDFQLPGLE